MNHPFWLANSMLFFFAFFAGIYSFFSQTPFLDREDIEPAVYGVIKKEERQQVVNSKQIYENDLFGTYKKDLPPAAPVVMPSPFPEPPKPQLISAPEQQALKFLEPLNITLKGIMVVSTSDKKNRVIISDNKTDFESMYKVGDMVSDAQLIRIFRNKVIFLRANGQQELFYLRDQDAKFDPAYASIDEWGKVVQELPGRGYRINVQEFTSRVTNLAQFFSLLLCSTAYKDGESVGIQIGDIEPKSLGVFLGLKKGDIVKSINDIPATTIQNRMAIYKDLINFEMDTPFVVVVQRNKRDISFAYSFYTVASGQEAAGDKGKKNDAGVLRMTDQEKEIKLREKYELAPTIDEIKKRERQNMLEQGRAPLSEIHE